MTCVANASMSTDSHAKTFPYGATGFDGAGMSVHSHSTSKTMNRTNAITRRAE